MSDRRQLFPPPPSHPSQRPNAAYSGQSSHTSSPRQSPLTSHPPSPSIPPRPTAVSSSTPSLSPATLTEAQTPQAQIPRLERIPGSVENLFDPDSEDDGSETLTLRTNDEEQLSTEELRELYDEEEIERFLSLFSAYVTEVELPRSPSETKPTTHLEPQHEPAQEPSDISEEEDSGWVDARPGAPIPPITVSGPALDSQDLGVGLAAWAASKLLLVLPPPQPVQPPFSIKRAQLAANRLFLALEPTYFPILKRLWDLATWKDFGKSLFYCFLYWIMWYNGLLLSGLFIRVLYALLRRRYLPYPTAAELRQYRREVELAENFSRSVILRVATSPAMNVHDAWTTFKEYRASKKKAKSEADLNSPDASASTPQIVIEEPPVGAKHESEMTQEELETVPPILEAEHVATPIMHVANRISDIHERIKNIFLWRRPNVSFAYALVLLLLAVSTALVPAKYLTKALTMGLGVFFWHVVPVLATLPPADRARIPPPLRHSATDAEYAMELISQRVARGLPVKPKRKKKKTPFGSRVDVADRDSLKGLGSADATTDRSVDWDRWGDRVVKTKAWAGDVKQVFKGGNWKSLDRWAAANPLRPRDALIPRSSEPSVETHTFPAQRKGPGLITLTDTMLYYTSLASSTPELSIKLEDILAVKKSGMARGLKIRWTEPNANGVEEEHVERFLWVGDRDSLFARLVVHKLPAHGTRARDE